MSRKINSVDFGSFTGNIKDRIASPQGMAIASFPNLYRDQVFHLDDFLVDTLNLDFWVLSTDGTATAFAITPALGGTIRGNAGETDNGYLAINGPIIFSGDKNAGMEVRLKLDAITAVTFEIGFTDALSDETLPAVTDVDTPATGNGATDVAVVHLDTDQTLQSAAFVGESTGSTYAAQKVNLAFTPTAATYFTVRVQLATDNAFCAIFDANGAVVKEGSLSLALEGATLVRPHVIIGTRSVSDRVPDIDYIAVWQDR